jgi:hypothetical protein
MRMSAYNREKMGYLGYLHLERDPIKLWIPLLSEPQADVAVRLRVAVLRGAVRVCDP